jgi:hypothetical protein
MGVFGANALAAVRLVVFGKDLGIAAASSALQT